VFDVLFPWGFCPPYFLYCFRMCLFVSSITAPFLKLYQFVLCLFLSFNLSSSDCCSVCVFIFPECFVTIVYSKYISK
jgi:hypothetical protein